MSKPIVLTHLTKAIGILLCLFIFFHNQSAFGQPKCSDLFESAFKIHVADVQVEVGPRIYHVFEPDGWFYFKAKLEDRQVNIRAFLVNHEERFRSTIRGTDAFANMIEHFGKDNIDVIQGRWFPFSVSNFQSFKKARERGHSMEEAAFSTWTGRQAAKYGYVFVDVNIERANIRGNRSLSNQNSENFVEYIKANFYKTMPSPKGPSHRPRVTRSLPMIE